MPHIVNVFGIPRALFRCRAVLLQARRRREVPNTTHFRRMFRISGAIDISSDARRRRDFACSRAILKVIDYRRYSAAYYYGRLDARVGAGRPMKMAGRSFTIRAEPAISRRRQSTREAHAARA